MRTETGTLRVGSGTSRLEDAAEAGRQAAEAALDQLGDAPGGLVLVYATVRYDLPALIGAIREVTGTVPLAGASSSGQFSDGEFLPPGAGVVVMVLSAGPYDFATAAVTGLRAGSMPAGRDLARTVLAAAGPDRAPFGALLLLADGLAGDMQGLLTGIYRVTGAAVPVVGGAAAADHSFDGTFVFHDGEVLTDGAVAVWIGADRPLRVVSGHGWEAQGVPLLVTKVEGTVVHEIAGRPAIDVYRENFRFEDPMLESPDNAVTGYHSAHSFGLIEPDGTQVIRGAFVGPDGELRTFSPLPPFCAVQIVSATREELLDVSEQVVGDALSARDGEPDPTVMLTFSCVARMDLLGERGSEEAVRLQRAAGDVSTFGFYTYGEFARTTSVAGYHNATITAITL